MSDDLLKWVAEFLSHPYTRVLHPIEEPEDKYLDYLRNLLLTWHGIGLVIAEMEKRGFAVSFDTWSARGLLHVFFINLEATNYHAEGDRKEPWVPVFTAARRAMEGEG
jgi:hypothetical protein